MSPVPTPAIVEEGVALGRGAVGRDPLALRLGLGQEGFRKAGPHGLDLWP